MTCSFQNNDKEMFVVLEFCGTEFNAKFSTGIDPGDELEANGFCSTIASDDSYTDWSTQALKTISFLRF